MGITCTAEDLQKTENGEVFLTLSRDELSRVYAGMSAFISGLAKED